MKGLAPAPTTTSSGVNVEAATRTDVARRRRAQLVDAGRRRVAVLAAADRGDRGVLDVVRRREVRLADAERHDVLAAARQRVHLGQHDECVLGAERIGAPRQRRHGRQRCGCAAFIGSLLRLRAVGRACARAA